jgi:REP element-mobilizing transposase RayT
LVIAYHLIWTGYGWWLPNDPRGSGSHTIRNPVLHELGELHLGRRRIQPAGKVVREFYERAHSLLKHPVISFDDSQFECIAAAFAHVIATQNYTCYACAIMPDHLHILIRKHKHRAEEMIERLQDQSRVDLCAAGLLPFDHPVWTKNSGWKVFLDSPDDIWRTINYIDDNPLRARRPAQRWSFVTPYNDWPLHKGANRAK